MRHARLSMFFLTLLPLATLAAQDKAKPKIPDIPAEFADADAVILRWEQSWTPAAEGGGVTYHELKYTLIRNDRALGAFADPRITFNNDYQSVTVLTARTRCPDGRIIETPDYSRNELSPYGVSGWPAFAAIRQLVVTFGGIEPGCVIEFEWERTTKPGTSKGDMTKLAIQECIPAEYPTLQRRIKLGDQPVREWKNVPAIVDEPHGVPSLQTHEYLTSHGMEPRSSWILRHLDSIEAAGRFDDEFKTTVLKWVESESDSLEKAHVIRKTLADRLNIIHVSSEWTFAPLRPANVVLKSRYASGPEAAALLLAAFRAAGLDAAPFLVTEPIGQALEEIDRPVPNPIVAEYGVALAADEETTLWHPVQGRIRDPGPWGGRWLYERAVARGGAGQSQWQSQRPKVLGRAGDTSGSRLDVDIQVKIDSKATWTADFDCKTTGFFVDPDALRTQDGKNGAVQAMVDRVLPNARVDSFTVTTLSDDTFAVTGKLTSTAELTDVHGDRMLTLPQDGPWTTKVSLPLGRSERKTPVRIAGPFRQTVHVDIRLPDEWQTTAVPPSIAARSGEWGAASLTVAEEGHRIQWTQSIEVKGRDIAAKAFGDLRSTITGLQAERARTFVFRAGGKQG